MQTADHVGIVLRHNLEVMQNFLEAVRIKLGLKPLVGPFEKLRVTA